MIEEEPIIASKASIGGIIAGLGFMVWGGYLIYRDLLVQFNNIFWFGFPIIGIGFVFFYSAFHYSLILYRDHLVVKELFGTTRIIYLKDITSWSASLKGGGKSTRWRLTLYVNHKEFSISIWPYNNYKQLEDKLNEYISFEQFYSQNPNEKRIDLEKIKE